jgi:phage-related protein
MGDSRQRLRAFPAEVRSEVGQAIYNAERGDPHESCKRMKRINAIEIVSDHDGDTYRCVFTTKFKGSLYVLHTFKKKSTSGIKTPQREIDLICKRLAEAEKQHQARKA